MFRFLGLLVIFWGQPLWSEDQQLLQMVDKYCVACHQGYEDLDFLKANKGKIYPRLEWIESGSFASDSMPPRGAFRDAFQNESQQAQSQFLNFFETEQIPVPEPIDKKVAALKVPSGFKIYRYANLKSARSMSLAPNGVLYVGTGGFSNPDDKVYALYDSNNNQKIESNEIRVVARGLNNPNGVAYRKGDLYVAETQRIRKFSNIDDWFDNQEPSIQLNSSQLLPQRFPSGPGHAWKFIRFAPAPNDHLLYVPVGATGNVHPERDGYAAIFRIDVRGSLPRETVAKGVRNTVGFDFHPQTSELWFTDNGRDSLGDGFPPDELNKVSKLGQHFGFPYCHGPYRMDGKDRDPQFNQGRNCRNFVEPQVALDPHAAALGMRFYTGVQFPEEYRQQIFIAEHGSWNVSPGNSYTGYRVSLVREKPEGGLSYEDFVSGWLEKDGRTRWGRPVDIEIMDDGSLLISDDGLRRGSNKGSIYRVVYQ